MNARRPVAVVTGANRGIGLEVCRQLADAGFLVVLGSRNLDHGRSAAAALDRSSCVTACQLDVTDERSVGTMATWVRATFGRCDALVNNAAILYDPTARAEAIELAVVYESLETNLLGA